MSFHVVSWVLKNSEAKLGARLVLITLAEFGHDDGTEAFPSLETLVERTRMTRKGVQLAIKRLLQDGHIEETGRRSSGTRVYRLLMPVEGGVESTPLQGANEMSAEGVPRSASGVSTTPDPTDPSKTLPPKSPQQIEPIFEHWKLALGKPKAVLTDERRRKIKARLKDYPPERILRAIDGCAASEFHTQNQHTDIELICRTGKHLERFESMPTAQSGGPRRRDGTEVKGGGVLSRRTVCRSCPAPITDYQANNQHGLCDGCNEERFGEAA